MLEKTPLFFKMIMYFSNHLPEIYLRKTSLLLQELVYVPVLWLCRGMERRVELSSALDVCWSMPKSRPCQLPPSEQFVSPLNAASWKWVPLPLPG